MLHIARLPPVYDRWLNEVVPTWANRKADQIDAMRAKPPYQDGAIRLAIDLTNNEMVRSPIEQNAFVLLRAAEEADRAGLAARGRPVTLETMSAMREAMDWPGCLFEEEWRVGKRLRKVTSWSCTASGTGDGGQPANPIERPYPGREN